MKTKAEVYKFLFDWLVAETGLKVIMANEKGPRPNRPYVSLNFLNASAELGGSTQTIRETVNEDGDPITLVNTAAMRKAVASINVFGDNAIDTLSKVRDSLDRPDVTQKFEAAEIAHLDNGPVNDLTALQETIYEERGQMDLTVSFAVESEVDVGTIESVELDGILGGHNLTVNS